MCYTYDNLSRVTARTVKSLVDDSVISTEAFTYDAAGNITGTSADTAFVYDTNNRLTSYNGNAVSYDLDGNMLSNGTLTYTYDSSNRLISAGGHTYTYNAEDMRIRNLCTGEDTTYTYNTNAKLSMLLMKTTNGVVTKYVYGRGLIGEEVSGAFKTYHFDCRGSTVAITDENGNITDTFTYDTYGKCISRTGTSDIIFCYNGSDGVVTDDNGLIYMRARYYSPILMRFVNADIVAGKLSNAITLNRFAYANGNPVSNVDPFGLSADNKDGDSSGNSNKEKFGELTKSHKAVLVALFDYWEGGLPFLGHTRLYFLGDNGEWYITEFGTTGGSNSLEKKSNSGIILDRVDELPFFDSTGSYIKNPKGFNYVVLNGNFDKSVELAKSYSSKNNFGRYNFTFHNCSDYTNKLLDAADIDGMAVQMLSNSFNLISIPAIRELEFSIANSVDSTINATSSGMIEYGQILKESGGVIGAAGSALVVLGAGIGVSADLLGDAYNNSLGEIVGLATDAKKTITSAYTNTMMDMGVAIADGVVKIWNWILN